MNITFIVPKDHDQHSPLSQFKQCKILPPVGLARMAGLIGKKGSVSLVDERIETSKHKYNTNVAVIFINSYNRQRAYTLATKYKKCGSTVVFTGPILNQAPEDAANHADCLLLGSSEESLAAFLNDYNSGKTKPFYLRLGPTTENGTVYSFAKPGLSLAS